MNVLAWHQQKQREGIRDISREAWWITSRPLLGTRSLPGQNTGAGRMPHPGD